MSVLHVVICVALYLFAWLIVYGIMFWLAKLIATCIVALVKRMKGGEE